MPKLFSGFFKSSVVFILCICSWANGEEAVLPGAEDVVDNFIEATGGKNAYEKIKNIKFKATLKIIGNGPQIKAVAYFEFPDKLYSVTELDDVNTVTSGSDGKTVWEMSPVNGARILTGDERNSKLGDILLFRPDLEKSLAKSYKNLGITNVDGKQCYKIEVIKADGSKSINYYNKASNLLIKYETELKTPGGKAILEYYLEDYKKVGDILLSHSHKIKMGALGSHKVTFESVEYNIDMPKNIFLLPEKIKEII